MICIGGYDMSPYDIGVYDMGVHCMTTHSGPPATEILKANNEDSDLLLVLQEKQPFRHCCLTDTGKLQAIAWTHHSAKPLSGLPNNNILGPQS